MVINSSAVKLILLKFFDLAYMIMCI